MELGRFLALLKKIPAKWSLPLQGSSRRAVNPAAP